MGCKKRTLIKDFKQKFVFKVLSGEKSILASAIVAFRCTDRGLLDDYIYGVFLS